MLLNGDGIRQAWRRLQAKWSGVKASPFATSAVEIVFALLVSNAAIFISIFVYILINKKSSNLFTVALFTFNKSINTTEIIVYILGFFAPVMWIIVSNIRAWRHIGFLIVLISIQIIVILSTSIIYALAIADVLKNQGFANEWAWLSFILALIVWYATLVYDKKVLRHLNERIDQARLSNESGAGVLSALRGIDKSMRFYLGY